MFAGELLQAAHGGLLELHQALAGARVLDLDLPLTLLCTHTATLSQPQQPRNYTTTTTTTEILGFALRKIHNNKQILIFLISFSSIPCVLVLISLRMMTLKCC